MFETICYWWLRLMVAIFRVFQIFTMLFFFRHTDPNATGYSHPGYSITIVATLERWSLARGRTICTWQCSTDAWQRVWATLGRVSSTETLREGSMQLMIYRYTFVYFWFCKLDTVWSHSEFYLSKQAPWLLIGYIKIPVKINPQFPSVPI